MTGRLPAILLPPSKGQRDGGGGDAWHPGACVIHALDEARAKVLGALAQAARRESASTLAKTFGAQGATLDHAIAVNRSVLEAATMPAIERFDGVLYDELDYRSLPAGQRRRIDAMVLVFDAAFGVLAPRDPTPAHRVDFHASLPGLDRTGSGARLAAWWRPHLTEALRERLEGRVVWDLLPAEHSGAWDATAAASSARYTVAFVDRHGKTVSHWNKLLKGSLVRWLSASTARSPSELADFTHPLGYQWDPDSTRVEPWGARLVMRES